MSLRFFAWMLGVGLLAGAAGAAEVKTKATPKAPRPPRHDPPDMPFRRAPMHTAVRSVHLPLAANLHVAFDTELLRAHVAWSGGSLNLWGAVYHQAKDRFYCDFTGQTLFTNVAVFPWAVRAPGATVATRMPPGARFLGLSTKGIGTTLMYEVPLSGGGTVRIHEQPRALKESGAVGIVRRFEIAPCSEDLWFLAHAQFDGTALPTANQSSVRFRGSGAFTVTARGLAGLQWTVHAPPVEFKASVWSEAKNDSELKLVTQKGALQSAWLKIPQHTSPIVVEVLTLPGETAAEEVLAAFRGQSPTPPRLEAPHDTSRDAGAKAPAVFVGEKGFALPGGDEFYRVEHFPVPKEIELQVTGMDFLPDGNLAICTWLGDVYVVENPTGAPAAAKYRRIARGLCEPGGLKVIDGDIYIVQKQELTRLKDTDGNGEADLFECISQDWGYTGNYHDFSFGPTLDRDGNFHIFRNGNRGLFEVPLMGWDIVVSRDGRTLTPFCAGLRSPNGFGSYGPDRDVFMTENQGNWMASGKLNHFQKGRFYGYPSTTPAPKENWFDAPKEFAPPAVWFPYKLSRSASGIETIADERFGPFIGQMLVGEFQNATVMRVFLEKVNGEWQGAVWPMAKGFWSGVNRLAYGPDGKLYVGGCKNAAWAAVAPKDFSLDRVVWTGKVPFEVKEVRARRDGFELVFTQPVDAATAGKADNYDVSQYTYLYHQKYGSPEIDFDGKPDSASEIKVVSATVGADGLTVRLKLDGWRAGYVAAIRTLDLTNAEGRPLRNETFYYTLNQIPR